MRWLCTPEALETETQADGTFDRPSFCQRLSLISGFPKSVGYSRSRDGASLGI